MSTLDLVNKISSLTSIELSEIIKLLEEKFGLNK